MSNSYYAVKVGRRPGIYDNWADCLAQTDHYPNSQHRKFDSMLEARKYLGVTDPFRTLIAYIGGARNKKTLGVGVIFHDVVTEESISEIGSFSTKSCQNVAKWAPYFVGCYFAIHKAQTEKYNQLIICTNEPGLRLWIKKGYGKYTYMANRFLDLLANSKNIEIVFANGIEYDEELADIACDLAEEAAVNKINPIYNPLISKAMDPFSLENEALINNKEDNHE